MFFCGHDTPNYIYFSHIQLIFILFELATALFFLSYLLKNVFVDDFLNNADTFLNSCFLGLSLGFASHQQRCSGQALNSPGSSFTHL